jgi:hypothetical protein
MAIGFTPTCVITGRVVGDSDACGDCDPCIFGRDRVPEAVKRLLIEKDEWRDKYATAMEAADERDYREREMEQLAHDGQL